jgi:hypothetical protein
VAPAGLAKVNVNVDPSREQVAAAAVDDALAGDGVESRLDRDDRPVPDADVTNPSVGQLRACDEHISWIAADI